MTDLPKRVASRYASFQAEKQRILDWIGSFGDPLTLYRGIRVPSLEDISWDNLGRFWTPVKEGAHSPFGAGGQGEEVVLEGRVSRSDVDELETIATMRRYPSEREIRLKRGSVLDVHRIHTKQGVLKVNQKARTGAKSGGGD